MSALFRTTRFRIALWNALGVAGIALTGLVAVRQGVRWTVLKELDEILIEDAREIQLALAELTPKNFSQLADELRRKAAGHERHDWFVLLLDDDNHVAWQSEEAGKYSLDHTDWKKAGSHTVGQVRLYCEPVTPNRHGIARLCVGASLEFLLHDLGNIDRIVSLTSASIVFLAPILGYLLAGRAIRDVQLMSATAERLKPAALEERLPLRGSGDEFDRLAQTINSLLDRIAEYITQKRDFLADSAHELRTPLAAIRSAIEVSLSKPRSENEYCRLLEDVMEEAETLETLIGQILLMSEAQARPQIGNMEPVNLSDIVNKAADMFSGVAEANQIELCRRIARGVLVRGNKPHLRQLANNLIDNAIKYSPPRSRVEVTLGYNGSREAVQFSVADNGPGIPLADQPSLFERFYRVDKARSREGIRGTGLGLSICKTIAEAHGGTIDCQSEEGAGATFTVSLPMLRNGANGSR